MGERKAIGTCQFFRQFPWTSGLQRLGSQKQILALTLNDTCDVRFADVFLRAGFTVLFAGKLDPDVLGWKKHNAARIVCVAGYISSGDKPNLDERKSEVYFSEYRIQVHVHKWCLFALVSNYPGTLNSRNLESLNDQDTSYDKVRSHCWHNWFFHVKKAPNAFFLQPSWVIRSFYRAEPSSHI